MSFISCSFIQPARFLSVRNYVSLMSTVYGFQLIYWSEYKVEV